MCIRDRDQAASWTTQCLVCGGGNNISVQNRVLMQASCNQTSDMSHIDKEISADFMRNLSKFIKADFSWICRSAGNDHFWFVFQSELTNFIVVDSFCVIQAIWDKVIICTGDIDWAAVGQMTAMSEVESQNGISRF